MMALLYLLVAFTAIILHSAQSQVTESQIVANQVKDSILLRCVIDPWIPNTNKSLYWEVTPLNKKTRIVAVKVFQLGNLEENRIIVERLLDHRYVVQEEEAKKGNFSLTIYFPNYRDSGEYVCNAGSLKFEKIIARFNISDTERFNDCDCPSMYESCKDFLFFMGISATLPTLTLLFPLVGSLICPPGVPRMSSRKELKTKPTRRRKIIYQSTSFELPSNCIHEDNKDKTEILIDPKTPQKLTPNYPRPQVEDIV